MDLKKYLVPTIIVFIVITAFNLFFHGVLMEKLYMANNKFFRPQDEIHRHKYYMWIANLLYSAAFCYVYSKGHEKKGSLEQGLRYGLWISMLVWIPQTIVNYTVYPFPKELQFGWLAGYIIQSVLAGVVVATMYKNKIFMT